MKKNDWGEIGVYLILTILVCILCGIIFFINYVEENYELTNYLWIFNIVVIAIIPLYYFIHNNIEKRKTKKLEDSMIIKNINFKYYREIIKEYSPAMLSFLLDGIELKKDFTASVIYLINKGYFKLTEDNKLERTDKSYSELPEDLQVICNNFEDMLYIPKVQFEENQKQSLLKKQWFDSIEKVAVGKGLVIERKAWKITSFFTILCLLEVIYAIGIENIGLICISVILMFVLMFTKFWAFDENKWIKTQKGYEIYTKIVGLKNYIEDYSMLSESELKEITIWEDYLIYAIILNNTSKLNQEVKDFYKKIGDTIRIK